MATLVIYDNTGQIFSSPITGSYILPQGGLNCLEIEIPEGKILKSIDTSVTPNAPVYEDVPVSEIEIANEKINELTSENADINYALMMGGII